MFKIKTILDEDIEKISEWNKLENQIVEQNQNNIVINLLNNCFLIADSYNVNVFYYRNCHLRPVSIRILFWSRSN